MNPRVYDYIVYIVDAGSAGCVLTVFSLCSHCMGTTSTMSW
jgi:hypothetical protein